MIRFPDDHFAACVVPAPDQVGGGDDPRGSLGRRMTDDPRIAHGMRRQSELRRKRLDAGAKLIGWKVGFGASAAKERLQIAAPLVGFLLDRAVLPAGATVSLAGWQKPVAEPEIAVYLGRDVPAGADDATARAAVAALGP